MKQSIFKKLHSLSIYSKLAFMIFMIIVMFSSAVIFLALQSSKKQTNEIINEMILSNIQSNKDFIADAILAHDYWSLFKFLKSSSKNSIIKSAGITDKNFIVLADTNTKKHRLGTILNDKKNHTIIPFRKDGVLLGYFILNIQKNSIKKILEKNMLVFIAKEYSLMVLIDESVDIIAQEFIESEEFAGFEENIEAVVPEKLKSLKYDEEDIYFEVSKKEIQNNALSSKSFLVFITSA